VSGLDTRRPSLTPLALAMFIGQFGYVVFTAFAPLKNELSAEYTLGLDDQVPARNEINAGHTLGLQGQVRMSPYEFEYFYGLMYTAYGLPNFFMPLVTGAIIDHVGATKVLMACSLLNAVGAFWLCVGSLTLRPYIVLFGRLVLGFGNESLYVAAFGLLGEFLTVEEMPLMCGIVASGVFVANAVGSILAVPAFQAGGRHGLCLLLGAAALVQLCGNVECIRQRKRIEAADKRRALHSQEMKELAENSQTEGKEQIRPPHQLTARGKAIFTTIVICSSLNVICVWNFSMILCPSLAETWPPTPGESKVDAEEREGAWAFFYMMVPAIGNPLVGATIAALGCPGFSILISASLQSMGHSIFAFASYFPSLLLCGPLLPLLMISASNSFITPALYQCIALVVPTRHCSKAYGLMIVMQNVVMGLWPLLVAHLEITSGSYHSAKIAFVSVGFFGLVLWGLMLVLDCVSLGGSNTLLGRMQCGQGSVESGSKGM